MTNYHIGPYQTPST